MADTVTNYSEAALGLLKANLGYYNAVPPQVETYLTQLLNYAAARLEKTADIRLTPGDLSDDQLQAMYAAWMYRKGAEGAEKSPMLKEAIRDYQVSKALAETEALA